jgi:hypothetical protein
MLMNSCILSFNRQAGRSALLAGALLVQGIAPGQTLDPKSDLAEPAQKFVEVENGEYLKGLKRVIIPSFLVHFVTESKADAQINGIQVITGAPSDVKITLKGAEDARMQTLTEALYIRTVAQLTGAGIEVVPVEKLKAQPAYNDLVTASSKGPKEEDAKAGKGKFHTPQDLPLYHLDEASFIPKVRISLFGNKPPEDAFLPLGTKLGSAFSAGSVQLAEQQLAKELDAAILKVRITVLAGQLNVATNFWTGKEISTVAAASFPPLVNRFAFVLPNGNKARLSLREQVTSGPLGELVNVTSAGSQAADVARNVLSVALMLGGQRGIGYGRSAEYEWRVSPEDFEKVIVSYQPSVSGMFTQQLKQLTP